MGGRLLDAFSQYFSDGGEVLTNGQLRFFASGTNDPIDTFSDINLSTPNQNPLPLYAGGRVPSCFGLNQYYKVRLEYTDGTLIQEFDPVGGQNSVGEFGPWVNETVYSKDQITYYNSKYWRSTINGNQDNEPGVDEGWAELNIPERWDIGVTYPVDVLVFLPSGVYLSKDNGNVGHNPELSPEWWQRVHSVPIWGSKTSYQQYDLVMDASGLLYSSQQNNNLNHNPVGDSGVWWKPFWQMYEPFTKIKRMTGGGALTAYMCNVIEDGNTGYTLPPAITVPDRGWIVIAKSDTARTLFPEFSRSGSDTIRFLGGTDTAVRINTAWADSMILFSNGLNQWSF